MKPGTHQLVRGKKKKKKKTRHKGPWKNLSNFLIYCLFSGAKVSSNHTFWICQQHITCSIQPGHVGSQYRGVFGGGQLLDFPPKNPPHLTHPTTHTHPISATLFRESLSKVRQQPTPPGECFTRATGQEFQSAPTICFDGRNFSFCLA